MSNESATDLLPNFIARLPVVAVKAKAFLLGEELPAGVVMEAWERNAIRYITSRYFPSLQPAGPGTPLNFAPRAVGEFIGVGMSLAVSVTQPSAASSAHEAAVPEAAEFRSENRRKIEGFAGQLLQLVGSDLGLLSRLPSLKNQREFAEGYLRGLNLLFEDDGETLKNESAKMFLCFLFLSNAEQLRPMAGMTITQVHQWVNEQAREPISLENVRKVAGELELKLADVGHPPGQLLPTVKSL